MRLYIHTKLKKNSNTIFLHILNREVLTETLFNVEIINVDKNLIISKEFNVL